MKRKSVRFPADANSLAVVTPQLSGEKHEYVGLLLNESAKGCRAAFRHITPIAAGDVVRIAAGALGPFQAKVAWIRKLGDLVIEVGFEMLE